MKKSNKVLVIMMVVLLVIGSLFMLSAVVVAKGDFSLLTGAKAFEEKNYSVASSGISNINLRGANAKLNATKSNDDQIHLTYFENDKEHYDISVSQSGELSIIGRNDYQWYDYLRFNLNSSESIDIAIPDNSKCNLSLRTSNGNMTVNSLSVDGNISSETSNGSIDTNDINITGSFDAKTTNGAITENNISSKEFSANSSNGKINLTNVTSLESITGTTSNGEIGITNIIAGTGIRLQSSNGRISGIIKGNMRDFGITSHTSNGSNNLPNNMPGGTKTLDVTTSNGAIDISFMG
jgi:hypothetical protein